MSKHDDDTGIEFLKDMFGINSKVSKCKDCMMYQVGTGCILKTYEDSDKCVLRDIKV